MMFEKSHHEEGVFSCGSLTLTSHMNHSCVERSFTQARRRSAARTNRNVSGSMFSHGSRTYRHA